MKRISLFLFTLLVCVFGSLFLTSERIKADTIPNYKFTQIANFTLGDGYYRRTDTGQCKIYPKLQVSPYIDEFGYCTENGVNFNSMEAYTVNSCDAGAALTCEQKAAAYFGYNSTDFYKAQSMINGRQFYTGSACSTPIDKSDLEARASEYCWTWPTFAEGTTINLKVGQTVNLTDIYGSLPVFEPNYLSTDIRVSKSGNVLSITGIRPVTGAEIWLTRGSKSSYTSMCSDASQDYIIPVSLPYVRTILTINVTQDTPVTPPAPTYGSLKLTKVNESNTPLQGVKFKIGTNLSGLENGTWRTYTTNSEGTITINEIPTGTTYYYQEAEEYEGYIYDDTIRNVTIYTAEQYSRTITNYAKVVNTGSLKIVKRNQFDELLQGVKFKIGTDLNGTENTDWKYYTTDVNGEIIINNIVIPEGLSTIYSYQEVDALDGYVFTDAEKIVKEVTLIEANFIEIVGVRNNKIIDKNFKIIKRNKDTNEAIANVKFEIHKVSDDTLVNTLTTDTNGEATMADIEFGEYYAVETSAPNGYSYSTDKYPFEITEDNPTYLLEVDNVYNGPKTGLTDVALIAGISVLAASTIFLVLRKRQRFI